MSTLREQITARFAACLVGATPAGSNVFRSREASITRGLTPAIVVMPVQETVIRMGNFTDRHELTLGLEIFTRGDPWDTLADSTAEVAHKTVVNDAQILAFAVDVRKVATEYESQEADRTAGVLTSTYALTYLTKASDVAAQP